MSRLAVHSPGTLGLGLPANLQQLLSNQRKGQSRVSSTSQDRYSALPPVIGVAMISGTS